MFNFSKLSFDELVYKNVKTVNWFSWISILSIINSIIVITGLNLSFVFGLGASQFLSELGLAFNQSQNENMAIVAFVASFAVSAIFLIFRNFALKGSTVFMAVGTVLYLVDAIVTLYFADYISFAFHLFAGFFLVEGFFGILYMKKHAKNLTNTHKSEESVSGTKCYKGAVFAVSVNKTENAITKVGSTLESGASIELFYELDGVRVIKKFYNEISLTDETTITIKMGQTVEGHLTVKRTGDDLFVSFKSNEAPEFKVHSETLTLT